MSNTPETPSKGSAKPKDSKPPSKLDPYSDLITLLLTKGESFKSIAKQLSDEFKLTTAPGNIHSFLKTRRKRALKEYTYNAIQSLHVLYVFTTGTRPSYDRLVEDLLNPSRISDLYQPLYHEVQELITTGNPSYVDRRKYEACFHAITTHWINLPAEIKDSIIDTLQNNTPNSVQYFLKNHISKPERAKPEFFKIR